MYESHRQNSPGRKISTENCEKIPRGSPPNDDNAEEDRRRIFFSIFETLSHAVFVFKPQKFPSFHCSRIIYSDIFQAKSFLRVRQLKLKYERLEFEPCEANEENLFADRMFGQKSEFEHCNSSCERGKSLFLSMDFKL